MPMAMPTDVVRQKNAHMQTFVPLDEDDGSRTILLASPIPSQSWWNVNAMSSATHPCPPDVPMVTPMMML